MRLFTSRNIAGYPGQAIPNTLCCEECVPAGQRGLFAMGTTDQHYAPAYRRQAEEATAGQGIVIDGAGQSPETQGNVMASLRAIDRFLG